MIKDHLRNSKIDQLTTINQDMRGRRIVNASDALDNTDYVTKRQLDSATKESNFIDVVKKLLLSPFSYIITRLISPATDTESAIRITKSNRINDVIVVDTVNNFTRFTGSARFETNTNPTTGAGLEVGYWTGNYAYVQGYARSGSAYLDTRVDGSSVRLGYSNSAPTYISGTGGSISFFGATVASKQTLNAYTTSNRSSSFTATPATVATAATLVDLNTLRASYEILRLAFDDLRTKLQTTTLVG